MSARMQGRTEGAGRRGLAVAAAVLLAGLAAWPGGAAGQQANFRPLERGEFTEVEERVMIAQGLEVSADYAFDIGSTRHEDLAPEAEGTSMGQDLRLRLHTVFHRDVEVRLTLQLGEERFSGTNLRTQPEDAGELRDGLPTTITAREAYLRYNFNPRSGLLFGKYELSLGDRRGKVFNAVAPALTFDCEAGTWCVPFGVVRVGPLNSDAVTHIALQYTAWDEPYVAEQRNALRVEVYRVHYNESNVPLGRNFGPTVFNPADPKNDTTPVPDEEQPHPTQFLEGGTSGEPIYYDAEGHDFFGFRVAYQGGATFVNFDATGYRGVRRYHLFDASGAPEPGNLAAVGRRDAERDVRGTAIETEVGLRFGAWRTGLRAMSATGDKFADPLSEPDSYLRDLSGYHEITPGSYAGTRLWFNGADSQVTQGAGLGHSINNTQLVGLYVDYSAPEDTGLAYTGGLFALSYNEPIPNANDVLVSDIGVELNNILAYYPHKALRFEVEANAIVAGEAFRLDDISTPDPNPENLYQFIGRVVYSF